MSQILNIILGLFVTAALLLIVSAFLLGMASANKEKK